MKPIKTTRLCLREGRPEDEDAVWALWNDETVLRYNCVQPLTHEAAKQLLTHPHSPTLYLEQRSSHTVIGQIALEPDTLRYGVNSIALSYALLTPYTAQGFMSEAMSEVLRIGFTLHQADVITARIFFDNQRSRALIERFHFKREGILRHAVKGYDGVIHDDCLYALTKEAYRLYNPL